MVSVRVASAPPNYHAPKTRTRSSRCTKQLFTASALWRSCPFVVYRRFFVLRRCRQTIAVDKTFRCCCFVVQEIFWFWWWLLYTSACGQLLTSFWQILLQLICALVCSVSYRTCRRTCLLIGCSDVYVYHTSIHIHTPARARVT